LALAVGSSVVALSGCSSVLPISTTPPRTYRLTSKSTYPSDLRDVKWQLVVETPFAPASTNTDRIGLMETPLRFNYYANANWVDRAPLMVQQLIIESFDNSGAIVGVGPESVGLRPDFVLKSELREFQAHVVDGGRAHRVHVVLNARLVEMPERRIIAVEHFARAIDVPPDQLDPIIQAFDDALGAVMKRMVIWTLTRGEDEWRRSGGSRQFGTTTNLEPAQAENVVAPPVRPVRRLPRPKPSN
jgi:cholesterol transport system auxiliary component